MKKVTRLGIVVALAGAGLLATLPEAKALGFRNADQGAAATAQGEAFIAQADDASAVYYNPAGLVQLTGTHVAGGSYLLFREIDFTGPAYGAFKAALIQIGRAHV